MDETERALHDAAFEPAASKYKGKNVAGVHAVELFEQVNARRKAVGRDGFDDRSQTAFRYDSSNHAKCRAKMDALAQQAATGRVPSRALFLVYRCRCEPSAAKEHARRTSSGARCLFCSFRRHSCTYGQPSFSIGATAAMSAAVDLA